MTKAETKLQKQSSGDRKITVEILKRQILKRQKGSKGQKTVSKEDKEASNAESVDRTSSKNSTGAIENAWVTLTQVKF